MNTYQIIRRIKAGFSTMSTNSSHLNRTSLSPESIFPRIPTNKPCTPPKSNMQCVLQTRCGEGGYRLSAIKLTTENSAAEAVGRDRCQSRTRVPAASHPTPPSPPEPLTFVSNNLPLLDFWLPLMFAQITQKTKTNQKKKAQGICMTLISGACQHILR